MGIPLDDGTGSKILKTETQQGEELEIVRTNVKRGDRVRNHVTLSTTAETTLLAAVASERHDLNTIVIANTNLTTAVRVDLRDSPGGTVISSIMCAAADIAGFSLGSDYIEQTNVNTAWTVQLSAAVSDVRIFAQAFKVPV